MNGHARNDGLSSWSDLISNHEIDAGRPLKVICIGAGVAGIIMAIRLPEAIPKLELTLYDKNPEVGGTWLENRYPGVRCDIPSHAYQLTFESNTQWSEFYATGSEIQDYVLAVAKKYDVYRFCKFRRLFTASKWLETEGKWEVTVKNLDTGETETDYSDVLIMATGLLNKWHWPKIPGLDRFAGIKTHSADYDPSIDLKDKEVALIGGGSSGIQILPAIQPIVKRVDHYMKGQNWIAPMSIGSDEVYRRQGKFSNMKHEQDELDKFKNPETYLKFRHKIEGDLMQAPYMVFEGREEQKKFHALCKAHMEEKLAKKPEIIKFLLPEWSPGCRRLTPGPGYLEACCEKNVDFISTGIKKIHENCIETVDGKKRYVDVIICATGFDASFRSGPNIVGKDGKILYELWDPYPEAYLSVCAPNMPNFFILFGPNGGPLTGSAIAVLEWVGHYVTQAIAKIQREFYKSMTIKPEANKAFSQHVDKFFDRTVLVQPCSAWSKSETGRIVGNWPGSGVHARKALLNPRWEDFDWEPLPATEENRMGWLGMGMTVAQRKGGFTTDYLDINQTVNKPVPIHPEISVDSKRSNLENGVK